MYHVPFARGGLLRCTFVLLLRLGGALASHGRAGNEKTSYNLPDRNALVVGQSACHLQPGYDRLQLRFCSVTPKHARLLFPSSVRVDWQQ